MPQSSSPQTNSQEDAIKRLRSLSNLLDSAIPIPGTPYSIGLDPFLGLLPVLGDYAGAILSGYIVLQAARLGSSKATLTRMVVNIIIEVLVGSIPMLGDIFDAGWKANVKNVALLEAQTSSEKDGQKADILFLAFLLGSLALIVVITTAISLTLLRWLLQITFG